MWTAQFGLCHHQCRPTVAVFCECLRDVRFDKRDINVNFFNTRILTLYRQLACVLLLTFDCELNGSSYEDSSAVAPRYQTGPAGLDGWKDWRAETYLGRIYRPICHRETPTDGVAVVWRRCSSSIKKATCSFNFMVDYVPWHNHQEAAVHRTHIRDNAWNVLWWTIYWSM